MHNEGNVTGSEFFRIDELPTLLRSAEEQPSAGNTILIFSKEPDSRVLLKTFLEIWGFQAEESDCLEESLSIIENRHPNLIILDSILPFEKHLENIRQIRRNKFSKEIPIIVISGFSQPQFKSLALAVGADGFLVKPLDFDLLEDYLKKNIEKHCR